MNLSTQFKKGQIPWNKKVPIEKICPKCSKRFFVRPSLDYVKCCSKTCSTIGKPSAMKGRKMPEHVKAKHRKPRLSNRGINHYKFRDGGIERKERHVAHSRYEYRNWRRIVFERDNFTCQWCNKHNGYLEAHHIIAWSKEPKLRYEIENGITLCLACHKLVHSLKNFGTC